MGAYHFILKKLNTLFDSDSYLYISSFIFGGAVGIITFSRIIKWLFKSYEKRTMVVMIGFIIGSVSKIIPNKNNDENIFLITYDFFSTSYSLFFFSLIGFLVIILLNKISK